jgi:predicted GIY-YIG superfamily endonuclease
MPKDFGIKQSGSHTPTDTIYSDSFWPVHGSPLPECFLFFLFLLKVFFMVYLIHFTEKLHHAQHYIGFVEGDLGQRITLHKMSRGAKLLAAVNEQKIEWQVVRIWPAADRHFERKLKNYKKARCFCPLCGGNR